MRKTELKKRWLRTLIAEQQDIFEEDVPQSDIEKAITTNLFYHLHFHEIALVTSQSEQVILVLMNDKNEWLSAVITELD